MSLFLSLIKPLQKKRPAVVISSNSYNTTSPDIVIMAITSQTKKFLEIGECLIKNWKEAGLLKFSAIKPAISTIEQKLLEETGCASTDDLASLNITLTKSGS